MVLGITGNTYNKLVPQAVYEFLNQLTVHKIRFVIDENLHSLIRRRFKIDISKSSRRELSKLIRLSDFIVSFGGDGTFLSTAKLVGKSGKPIIGVNLGKLGFLADITTDRALQFVMQVKKGKYKIEKRSMLEASFRGEKEKLFGLNEIVIGKTGSVKTVRLETYYDNRFVITYHADGLIVCTPTGTTAYSMSAGGPIVDPGSKVFVLTPICPHSLTARPIVLPDKGKIRIEVNSRVPIVATADGNEKVKLKRQAVINIKKADYTVNMVKTPDSDYYDVLNKKLLLGEDVRK